MLYLREYGQAGPHVVVLHGGPGASGHMAPVAAALSDAWRVLEPWQRGSGGEPLTVARHVADLAEVIACRAPGSRPAILGASWGAMLALAYAAAHPDDAGPLILVGCGTFDPVARAELQRVIAERMDDGIRTRLREVEALAPDERLRAEVRVEAPIYSYDVSCFPHEEDRIDAQALQESWGDMVKLQDEGVYPEVFRRITVPVLMIHGDFDPGPGKLIFENLKPFIPHLEYREIKRCGHYPWLEKYAADAFYAIVREWLSAR